MEFVVCEGLCPTLQPEQEKDAFGGEYPNLGILGIIFYRPALAPAGNKGRTTGNGLSVL